MEIDSRYITPFFSSIMQDDHSYNEENDSFKEGDIFELKGVECDGFSMLPKRYKVIKCIDSINDVEVDAVVMKEVEDYGNTTIFSLTKADCANLNIDFEPKLQIFPRTLNWQRIKEEQEQPKVSSIFDPLDLSTYPVDFQTKKIKYMTIKISGCIENNYSIVLPDMSFIAKSDLHRLQISLKNDIGIACELNNVFLPKNTVFPYQLTTSKFSRCEPNKNFVDANGCMFIEFAIYSKHYKVTGIDPILLKNKMFNEVFSVRISNNSQQMQMQYRNNQKYVLNNGGFFISL